VEGIGNTLKLNLVYYYRNDTSDDDYTVAWNYAFVEVGQSSISKCKIHNFYIVNNRYISSC